MIKNERQYRITRAQAGRFSEALRKIEATKQEQPKPKPHLGNLKEEALRSQLADLEDEIREYEALKSGYFSFEPLRDIAELPRRLIRARIASGLSQRNFADRLGLKEQQIQRYEATEYASASYTRIKEVVTALNMDLDGNFLSGDEGVSFQDLLDRVSRTGLSIDFIRKRLFPRRGFQLCPPTDFYGGGSIVTRAAAETIGRIFHWSPQQILLGEELRLEPALDSVRFKVTVNANSQRVSAYTVYAHYLSLLALQACTDNPIKIIPTDPIEFRFAIESHYGDLSLAAIVNYLWDLGVVVLPLDDPGAFHGACFREAGRNVIVLKQKTSSCSRWAFDCLHECWHAGQEPELSERTVLELDVMSLEGRGVEEEITASRFAGAVLLNGKGQELAEKCLSAAGYDLRKLKTAVQRVAVEENVAVASLANYLAFRLAEEQGENWWGAANSLQDIGNPWNVVRNLFFERADFSKLSEPDRELMTQALAPWEDFNV